VRGEEVEKVRCQSKVRSGSSSMTEEVNGVEGFREESEQKARKTKGETNLRSFCSQARVNRQVLGIQRWLE